MSSYYRFYFSLGMATNLPLHKCLTMTCMSNLMYGVKNGYEYYLTEEKPIINMQTSTVGVCTKSTVGVLVKWFSQVCGLKSPDTSLIYILPMKLVGINTLRFVYVTLNIISDKGKTLSYIFYKTKVLRNTIHCRRYNNDAGRIFSDLRKKILRTL